MNDPRRLSGNRESEQNPAYSPLWVRVRSQTPGEEAQATPLALQATTLWRGRPNGRSRQPRCTRRRAPLGAGSLFNRILGYRTLPKTQLQLPLRGESSTAREGLTHVHQAVSLRSVAAMLPQVNALPSPEAESSVDDRDGERGRSEGHLDM
jgi:hypothetical protein